MLKQISITITSNKQTQKKNQKKKEKRVRQEIPAKSKS